MKKQGKLNLTKSLTLVTGLGLGLATTSQVDQLLTQESIVYAQTDEAHQTVDGEESIENESSQVAHTVTVTDKDGKAISNQLVSLKATDGTEYSFETDENGIAEIEKVIPNIYKVVVEGYVEDKIDITESTTNIEIVLEKKDDESTDMITSSDDTSTHTSDNNLIGSSDNTTTRTVSDETEIRGNVIDVIDKEGKKLADTEVGVKDDQGKEVAKLVSNKEGQLILPSLVDGAYTIEVLHAPNGYTTNAGVKVIVKEGQFLDDDYVLIVGKSDPRDESTSTETSEVESESETSQVRPNVIQITDSNGKPLVNRKVNIYDKEGKLVATLTTDENGNIDINHLNLSDGKYKVELADEPKANQTVTIDETKEENKVKLPNTGEKSNSLIYGIGIILIIGGVGFYLYSKRKDNE